MGEKGTERHRSGVVGSKKGHVRVVKNSNYGNGQVFFQSIAITPKASSKIPSPEPVADGLSKKGRRSNECSGLPQTPNSRQGSPRAAYSPKSGSPRTSPSLGCHYAGAKFSEPPSPDSLPKPPMHWTGSCGASIAMEGSEKYREISQQLMMILKVQA